MNVVQYDRSKLETEAVFFEELFRQVDIKRESCIHCIVTEYNKEINCVSVQPLPKWSRDDGEKMVEISRPIIEDIPILAFAHGGFCVSSPIFVGDTGYLIAADRSCIKIEEENSAVLYEDDKNRKLNKGDGSPDDFSLTQYTNGFFIPCSWAKPEVAEDESGCFVIKGIGKTKGDDKWQRILLSNDGKIVIETDKKKFVIDSSGIVLDNNGRKISIGEGSVEIESDDRKITIDKDGIVFSGKTEEKLSLVTDIRYNVASHQLQAKRISVERSGNMFVNVGKEVGWTMIGGGQAEELVIE